MELRHLRYFVTVAETLNFRQAAARLQMTQPPLSYQIKQLEQEIGVQLFDRRQRSVRLTDAGASFLQDARAILAQASAAQENVRRIAYGTAGKLRIGFVGSVAYQWLPTLVKRYQEAYPDVEITLAELPTAGQIEALTKDGLDIGVLRPPVQSSVLHVETVVHEPIVVVLPHSHQLATRTSLQLADLADEEFVCFPRKLGAGSYDMIITACREAGFSPRIVQEAVQMSTLVGLVSAEIGIALVPQSVTVFRHPHVRFVELDDIEHRFEIALAWQNTNQTPQMDNFVSLCRSSGFVHLSTDYNWENG